MVSAQSLCVVIPYYQRTPEPLVRALRSLLAQQGVDRPCVLVVDDASPLPVRPLLDEYFPDHETFVRIIEQENQGAAGARNTALDHLPPGTEYVAFLDSDDEWTSHHLIHALAVLSRGCDFYFSNYQRHNWSQDRFQQMALVSANHHCFDQDRQLYEFKGDFLVPLMGQQMVKTSSVVYRTEMLSAIRFPEHLVLGEDDVFWLMAMRRSRRIGFCAQVELWMGEGVNISQGGEWGDLRSLQLMLQDLKKWSELSGMFPQEKELLGLCQNHAEIIRKHFVAGLLHRWGHGKRVPLDYLKTYRRYDPNWARTLWGQLTTKFFGRAS